jgi:hypothetical protein
MSLMSPLIPAPSPLNQEPPLHQPNPLPMPLGSSPFTPLLDSHPTELLLLKLSEQVTLKFLSLQQQLLGMATVQAWHWEQLLQAQK